jgi:hypothetical protein
VSEAEYYEDKKIDLTGFHCCAVLYLDTKLRKAEVTRVIRFLSF